MRPHDSRRQAGRNETRAVTATGLVGPKLYTNRKRRDLHALHTTTHSSPRTSSPPPLPLRYTSTAHFSLALQVARPGLFIRRYGYRAFVPPVDPIDHPKRQPDHIPTQVKFPTARDRKWISTTHKARPHKCRVPNSTV